MNHDLNDTLIFVKVVETGSFISAARALDVPKTTVSRKILALEQRLGARLIKRTTRRLGLTEAGSAYYERCRSIVASLSDAEAAVSELHSAPRGWLRVNMPHALAGNGITPMLDGFLARFPDVRVEIVASSEPLDLVASDIDLALRIGPLPDSSQSARRICGSPVHVYASSTYVSRHGVPNTPEQLRDHRTLAVSTQRLGGGRFAWNLRAAGQTGASAFRDYPIEPLLVGNDANALMAPLYAGTGLALLADGLVEDAVQRGLLHRVLAGWRAPDSELHIVFPPGRTPPPKARAFVDYVVEELRLNPCLEVCDRAMPRSADNDIVRVLGAERTFAAY